MYIGIKFAAEDAEYVDISTQVLTGSIDITEKLHNGLKPVCNSIRFRLKASAGLYRALFDQDKIYCVIKNGDSVLLRGFLRPIFSASAIKRTAPVNVEAVDFQYALKDAIKTEILIKNKPIFDADNLPNCILYQLFAPLRDNGIIHFSGDFIGNIPVFYAGTDQTYEAIVNALCYEYGFVYSIENDTIYIKKLIYDEVPESTYTFDETNMAAMPSIEKKEYAKDQVSVEWYGIAVHENDPVWEDTSGATGYWSAWIEVQPGGVYPDGADEKNVWANFGSAKGDLLHTGNLQFDINMDLGLAITDRTFETKRAAFKITNSTNRLQVIKRIRISGTSTVRTDKNYSKYPATTSNTVEKYSAQYIQTEEDAERLCKHLFTWAKNSRYVMSFTSSVNRPLGETVRYLEKDSGISFTCRIVEKRYDANCLTYRYQAEAVAKVVIGDASTDVSVGRPGATPESKPGVSSLFLYAASASDTIYPNFTASADSPGELWVPDMPIVSSQPYLWLTAAQWQGTVRISNWSLPIRLTGSPGVPGMPIQLPDDSRSVLYFSCDDVIGTKLINNAQKNSTGTLTGGKQVPGIGGQALMFTAGQFAKYENLPPLESLTLSVFFRLDSFGVVTQQSAKSLYIKVESTGIILYPTPDMSRQLSAPITLSTWYCVVYAYDHVACVERIKLYTYTVNSVGSPVVSGADAWQFSCTRDFTIDYKLSYDDDPDTAAGELDELRIDSYSWSDDECSGWATLKGGQHRRYTAADYSLGNIDEAVNESLPRYLGPLKLDPVYARIGDWYAFAGETTDIRKKGHCYRKISSNLWIEDTDMAHNMAAMQDLLDISKDAIDAASPAGDFISALTVNDAFISKLIASDAFINRLVANEAFIDGITTKTLTLKTSGAIQSENYDTGVKGFRIESNGRVEFVSGVFKDISISGNSVFSGDISSGPLVLTSDAPVTGYTEVPANTRAKTIVDQYGNSFGRMTGAYGDEKLLYIDLGKRYVSEGKYGTFYLLLLRITTEKNLYEYSYSYESITGVPPYSSNSPIEKLLRFASCSESDPKTFRLIGIPTAKPVDRNLVWNDGGTLKLS